MSIKVLYCNNLIIAEMKTKAADENRIIVIFYVTNTDNSLTANQMDAVILISRK